MAIFDQINRTTLLPMIILAFFSFPTLAAQQTLPLTVGHYYSDSADDCDSPAELTWDGKRFLADYVYMDNITDVKKVGDNGYELTSRTKTKDENTKAEGNVWIAEVTILSKGKFSFNQHSQKRKPNAKEARVYNLCK